jgi:hypothetical protein
MKKNLKIIVFIISSAWFHSTSAQENTLKIFQNNYLEIDYDKGFLYTNYLSNKNSNIANIKFRIFENYKTFLVKEKKEIADKKSDKEFIKKALAYENEKYNDAIPKEENIKIVRETGEDSVEIYYYNIIYQSKQSIFLGPNLKGKAFWLEIRNQDNVIFWEKFFFN